MKVAVTGKYAQCLIDLIVAKGVKVVPPQKSPDVIITYGGDGALLDAERDFPCILKFPVRDIETAPLCHHHTLEHQIDQLLASKLKITRLPKLTTSSHGRTLYGINDIFVHNSLRGSALRYEVKIDGVIYGREIVGDGAGVSTVHGSTAYYRSITHSIFRVGIGLSFSNSTELVNHLVLPETSVIDIRILRGPAELIADNLIESIHLQEGDEVRITQSDKYAEIIGLETFMCQECRRIRHHQRVTKVKEDIVS